MGIAITLLSVTGEKLRLMISLNSIKLCHELGIFDVLFGGLYREAEIEPSAGRCFLGVTSKGYWPNLDLNPEGLDVLRLALRKIDRGDFSNPEPDNNRGGSPGLRKAIRKLIGFAEKNPILVRSEIEW